MYHGMNIRMYAHMYVCVFVCVSECMYSCMYVVMCVYTYNYYNLLGKEPIQYCRCNIYTYV